jgi:hypothetical protein
MKRLLAGLSVALTSIMTLGCPNNPPPTPLTTTLNPMVRTLAIRQGLVDNVNTCSPATPPSPPAPDVWFTSLPITSPEKTANNGVVGFNVWRNTTDGCLEARQDLYRTRFSYDLTGSTNLRGLVTGAELTFSTVTVPAPSGIFCQAVSGGGGSLFRLATGTPVPAAAFTLLPPPSQFPTTGRIFGMTNPWIAGTIQPGVTTLASGLGGASWTVDLTNRVQGAIDQGLADLTFEISGSDETRITTSPAGSTDCRTVFRVGPLTIKHF